MRLLVVDSRAFEAAPPNQLPLMTTSLIALRRKGWQVVRGEDDERDLRRTARLLSHAVVDGVRAVVDAYGPEGAAACATMAEPLALLAGDTLTRAAVERAVDWGCETLAVVGPEADAVTLQAAIDDATSCVTDGVCVRELTVETLRMVVGAYGDGRMPEGLRTHDAGGLSR